MAFKKSRRIIKDRAKQTAEFGQFTEYDNEISVL